MLNHQYVDIFLCGGASSSDYISVRDQIRDSLNKLNNIRVLYPEDLFIEMLKDKKYNLLDLESFLADNSDIICIVCESAGSLVELGAFTNNEKTVNKVVALIDSKRKRDKSFIMLGPIKLLQKHAEDKVLFYDPENLKEALDKLSKSFKKQSRKNGFYDKSVNNKAINTLIGLHYFIPILLYFHKSIGSDDLSNNLKVLLKNKEHCVKHFDTLFRPALKLLYKDNYIVKTIKEDIVVYSLTEKGYMEVNRLLGGLKIENKDMLYDGIRFDIMRNRYYNGTTASPR